ncbi:MAG: hypothetical protein V2A54_07995 [Bacteroidota bacterium]
MIKKTVSMLFALMVSAALYAQSKLTIEVRTADSLLLINGNPLSTYHPDTLIKYLGKPSRFKTETKDSYIEEFSIEKGHAPDIRPIKIRNFYYIYDAQGLVFHTRSSLINDSVPVIMRIRFANQSKFDNLKFPDAIKKEFEPTNAFIGKMIINGANVLSNQKLFGDSVNYQTDNFYLYGIQFSPTSIGMQIDRLYSYKTFPYMNIFLNNAIERKISVISIYKM